LLHFSCNANPKPFAGAGAGANATKIVLVADPKIGADPPPGDAKASAGHCANATNVREDACTDNEIGATTQAKATEGSGTAGVQSKRHVVTQHRHFHPH